MGPRRNKCNIPGITSDCESCAVAPRPLSAPCVSSSLRGKRVTLFSFAFLCIVAFYGALWNRAWLSPPLRGREEMPTTDQLPMKESDSVFPVDVKLELDDSVESIMRVPGELTVELLGLHPRQQHELRISFVSTPIVHFRVDFLDDHHAHPTTHARKLLDTAKFRFYAVDASLVVEPPAESTASGVTSRRARIISQWGSPTSVYSDQKKWTHAHMVLSLHRVYLSGLSSDAIPVLIVCSVAVVVSVSGLLYAMSDDLRDPRCA